MKILVTFLALLFSFNAFSLQLKVMTYNTWGVPLVVWDRWRYQAAMETIEKYNPDIVILNEVFTRKGKNKFLSQNYPYVADGGRAFPRLTGSGLRILSKFPIETHAILTYRSCKKDDCLSRKGAALITLNLGQQKINAPKINIVATHLNSAGEEPIRIDQLDQLKVFSEYYADPSAPTVYAGDFNFGPTTSSYAHMINTLNVKDSWEQNKTGITYDTENNHYARDYRVVTRGPKIQERIDYIFTRGNIQTLSSQLVLNQEHELYSDHYALIGEFEI